MTTSSTALTLAIAMAAILPIKAAHAAEKAPKTKAQVERRVETLQIGPQGHIICTGDEPVCEAVRKAHEEGEETQLRFSRDGDPAREFRQLMIRTGPEGFGPRAFALSPEARGPRSVTQCTRSEAKETSPGVKTYTLTCTERQIGENEVVFLDRGGPGAQLAPLAPLAPPAPPAKP